MVELFNTMLGLQEWIPSQRFEKIQQNLETAHDNKSRIDLIENFLAAQKDSRPADAMVDVAIRVMRVKGGKVSISDGEAVDFRDKQATWKNLRLARLAGGNATMIR